MRVVSLIILLLVMGGVAFVFIHEPTRSWVFKKTKDVANQAEGYSLAKTPRDALDNFTKAVKDRNYQAAARYCSEDYAKMLENANEAGRKTGKKLDQIYNVMHNKGLYTPMAIDLLLSMDPFPDTYKVKDGSLKETKKGEVAEVSFEFSLEGKPKPASGRDLTSQEMEKIDPKMFRAIRWSRRTSSAKSTLNSTRRARPGSSSLSQGQKNATISCKTTSAICKRTNCTTMNWIENASSWTRSAPTFLM